MLALFSGGDYSRNGELVGMGGGGGWVGVGVGGGGGWFCCLLVEGLGGVFCFWVESADSRPVRNMCSAGYQSPDYESHVAVTN